MNVFILDKHPQKAAKFLCDRHVPKMVLESTQLLSNCFKQNVAPYKHTHLNHPVTLWIKDSLANWWWLYRHAIGLCQEYTKRYGKIHKCQIILEELKILEERYLWVKRMDNWGLTSFVQCMPEEYKIPGDAVQAYRNYYIGAKAHFAKWEKGTPKPEWWTL